MTSTLNILLIIIVLATIVAIAMTVLWFLVFSQTGKKWRKRRLINREIKFASSRLIKQLDRIGRSEEAINSLRKWKADDLDPVDVLMRARHDHKAVLKKVLKSKSDRPVDLMNALRSAGSHKIAKICRFFRGKRSNVTYDVVVKDVAKKMKLDVKSMNSVVEMERAILDSACKKYIESISEAERRRLEQFLEAEAQKHGKSFKGIVTSTSAVALAQASGFGIYLLASTLVGAITSALGTALPFAFYTTMSSSISVAIGPVGWAVLGLWGIYMLGSPNMKKTVPGVILIAGLRGWVEDKRLADILAEEENVKALVSEADAIRAKLSALESYLMKNN